MIVAEESPGYHASPRKPDKIPRILVLEGRHDALYAAKRLLESSGYTTKTIFEDEQALAGVFAAREEHVLFITAHDTSRPVSVPQLVTGLRQHGYKSTITMCVRGKVSSETRASYLALLVNRVLALPAVTQRDVLRALQWVGGQVALGDAGLTILEV